MNSAGFYDHILAHIKQMEEQGFLYENAKDKIRVITEPQQLIKYL